MTPDSVRVELSGEGGEQLLRRKRAKRSTRCSTSSNTAFRRELKDDRSFVVDCLDYRKGKDAELKQMARFMMEKAKTPGAPQEMGPLNPYARRLVHLTVAEDPQMSSESIGDAFLKTVIISVGSSAVRTLRRSRTARSPARCTCSTDDTIVAIATPPGRGGHRRGAASADRRRTRSRRALTGRRRRRSTPRHATLARMTRRGRRRVDQRRCSPSSRRPHSYTGEDVVEISAHGSPGAPPRDRATRRWRPGARLAEPGEFTFRAYLHGRIDLVQAEAVRDLIDAVTPLQARAAFDQLEGTLTTRIREIDARAVRSERAARGVARLSRRGLSLRRSGGAAARDRRRSRR